MPQHGVDVAGDMGAVLGADIAPAPEVVGRDIIARPLAGVDRGEYFDRGGDLRAGGQMRIAPPPYRRRGRDPARGAGRVRVFFSGMPSPALLCSAPSPAMWVRGSWGYRT